MVGRFAMDTGDNMHFTVGSLRYTRRTKGVDFRSELGLLKAALLYADNVRLVSVGASTVATLDDLRSRCPNPIYTRTEIPQN